MCLVEVVDGSLVEQDRIVPLHLVHRAIGADRGGGGVGMGRARSAGESDTFSIQEAGLLTPAPTRTGALFPGQVGYIITGVYY